MNNKDTITEESLIEDIKKAGVPEGCLLHLKVSLKSIGKVEGGPQTVLNAILKVVGDSGTIVIDSFVTSYPLPLSEKNASNISTNESPSFAGAVANAMVKHPKSVRSKHPIQRFTAIGPLAHELMDNHTPESGGYDVLERMAKMNALNLSIGRKVIGVGTTHVAIEKMKYKKKPSNMAVNYLADDGSVKCFVADWKWTCSAGFPKFLPLYEKGGALKWVKIGNAEAALTNMNKTLDIEQKRLEEDPRFFFCDDPTCKSCRLEWEHSTGNYFSVKFYSAIKLLTNPDALKYWIKNKTNKH
ncbi:AAC(3) family N-acetyltransferase [Carboxylicivirga caseinilyticus]|uniref:AAC(3) family N-acetyltransferase n=1 Tax=Carboxylicivirga caseinilyticus TaxID=3417572 RepID=UPI003D335A66|nr:AAC(3) family N-acetyltransferase [Marinilabiliaceae bacterium A049]